MVAGIAPATHAPEDVKDAPLPLDLHQTQATPALSDGYMSAEETVLDYYEALRRGEPLYSYFAEDADTWKAAISAEHEGYDAVAEALREQTRVTGDWTVESRGAVGPRTRRLRPVHRSRSPGVDPDRRR